ncbi:MAG: ABC transporter ATP-binding protein [Chloroflexota bacterium]|nr:ABC transporter ATP-binding protein [Chloroflexota bacterium]
MDKVILSALKTEFAYSDHAVLHSVDLALGEGDLVALLGPNGSGKTTLLKILCGILTPRAGRVEWRGVRLAALTRREIARRIALVPQELSTPFAFTVREMVVLGRTPHIRPIIGEMARDRTAVEEALELTETRALAARFFGDLSGGERQRVVIAMALAQLLNPAVSSGEPQVLLLDEPTVHLDINHQVEVLELIRKLNRERGLTVLATMHDLNLAALFFERLALLDDGHLVTEGLPRQVLSKERVENVFGAQVVVQAHPSRENVPHIIVLPMNGKTPI